MSCYSTIVSTLFHRALIRQVSSTIGSKIPIVIAIANQTEPCIQPIIHLVYADIKATTQ